MSVNFEEKNKFIITGGINNSITIEVNTLNNVIVNEIIKKINKNDLNNKSIVIKYDEDNIVLNIYNDIHLEKLKQELNLLCEGKEVNEPNMRKDINKFLKRNKKW